MSKINYSPKIVVRATETSPGFFSYFVADLADGRIIERGTAHGRSNVQLIRRRFPSCSMVVKGFGKPNGKPRPRVHHNDRRSPCYTAPRRCPTCGI